MAALSFCVFSELGKKTNEFGNKKRQICRVQQAGKRITARALFDSIHSMRQLQNRLGAC